ncbi:MAG: DegT/DnrJ/EryC1/StrS family aminotransferase [Tissierellia bacterium]|nr:DegT/DnrJ/EryC1/StrS family aminotransferase [Tissierellia bacterium]
MNIQFSPPDITEKEIEEVVDALKSGWITTGPKTKQFEKEIASYLSTNKAVALNSATAAMEMSLRYLGVGPGDEVITTPYTYTASASVINHVGAKIKMVDITKDGFEMDYDRLESVINSNTKAIIPVDIGGVPCDYEKILEIVESKKSIFKSSNEIQDRISRICILSDSAHSFGAKYKGKDVGQWADISCYSFHAVKNLTTAEGGAVTWREDLFDDEKAYNEFQLLSLHGQNKDALAKMQLGAWEYDIIAPNYKCNMTDIMSALGLAQLRRYPGLLARRKEIIEKYNSEFENTCIEPMVHFTDDKISTGHLYIVNLRNYAEKERNEVIVEMAERGISTNVHYKPLPMHTAYKNLGFSIRDYPNAYNRYKNVMTLPLHTLLSDMDVNFVAKSLKDIVS